MGVDCAGSWAVSSFCVREPLRLTKDGNSPRSLPFLLLLLPTPSPFRLPLLDEIEVRFRCCCGGVAEDLRRGSCSTGVVSIDNSRIIGSMK